MGTAESPRPLEIVTHQPMLGVDDPTPSDEEHELYESLEVSELIAREKSAQVMRQQRAVAVGSILIALAGVCIVVAGSTFACIAVEVVYLVTSHIATCVLTGIGFVATIVFIAHRSRVDGVSAFCVLLAAIELGICLSFFASEFPDVFVMHYAAVVSAGALVIVALVQSSFVRRPALWSFVLFWVAGAAGSVVPVYLHFAGAVPWMEVCAQLGGTLLFLSVAVVRAQQVSPTVYHEDGLMTSLTFVFLPCIEPSEPPMLF